MSSWPKTRSPVANRVVFSPTDSTSPARSAPRTSPALRQGTLMGDQVSGGSGGVVRLRVDLLEEVACDVGEGADSDVQRRWRVNGGFSQRSPASTGDVVIQPVGEAGYLEAAQGCRG